MDYKYDFRTTEEAVANAIKDLNKWEENAHWKWTADVEEHLIRIYRSYHNHVAKWNHFSICEDFMNEDAIIVKDKNRCEMFFYFVGDYPLDGNLNECVRKAINTIGYRVLNNIY